MKVSASKNYLRKEEVRQVLQNLLQDRVASKRIKSQADLDEFWETVELASIALKSVPYEVLARLTTVREVREIIREVLLEDDDS